MPVRGDSAAANIISESLDYQLSKPRALVFDEDTLNSMLTPTENNENMALEPIVTIDEPETLPMLDLQHILTLTQSDNQPLKPSQWPSVTISESLSSGSEYEIESETISVTSSSCEKAVESNAVTRAFRLSRSQWVDDPIINRWRNPEHCIHTVLQDVEKLHQIWRSARVGPFNPTTDELWLQIGRTLCEVGLPWHNNQINTPDEIDTSWPFHFKSFETQVIRAKGCRVGDPNPSGYVCNWDEANCYGIRALQQELRAKYPHRQPLLVYDQFDVEIIKSTQRLFGLQVYRVDLRSDKIATTRNNLTRLTENGTRPVIFAATLANASGNHDDISLICDLSQDFATILHVDASRSFDYITSMTDNDRKNLGIEKFELGIRDLNKPIKLGDSPVIASTIVAGGPNHTSPTPVIALKPYALGSTHTRVAYTRASDSTLAGSRDAIAPVWLALQEIRFGLSGFREIYQRCESARSALVQALELQGISTDASPYCVDIIIKGCSTQQAEQLLELGAVFTNTGDLLLAIQPSVQACDIENVVAIMSAKHRVGRIETLSPIQELLTNRYPVPEGVVHDLKNTVHHWKVATRSAAGYPFHMGSYSALGPVIGQFLDLKIPDDWIDARRQEILDTRMRAFGLLSLQERSNFKGSFTNGSTMGNRVGIHTALAHFPDAYLYFSSDTHYSVPKTARDCDNLTNRWSSRRCRYSEICSDRNGSMLVDELVRQVLVDREECRHHGTSYEMILFLNMGTTFVGARDNLAEIRRRLDEIDVEISYIHMDGALDFGFHNCGVVLGAPGIREKDGMLVAQGVTLSHHKAMGNMVSGEVLVYSPDSELAVLGSSVDPRAVFETWLYMQIYSPHDLAEMFEYCQDNASRLETKLTGIGVVTKRNQASTTTVLERPPAWITEEFSLRPQGDWVHFITMPHISTATVDLFVDRIEWVNVQCDIAFSYISPLLTDIFMQPISLQRVQCRHPLADTIAAFAQKLTQPTWLCHQSVETAIKLSLGGAMTVVALDATREMQAVFLAESTRDRAIKAGPVLARSKLAETDGMISNAARQLIGFVARHCQARLETDDMSFKVLCLA